MSAIAKSTYLGVDSLASAYILINCDLGAEEKVISELKTIHKIKEMQGVFGAY
ncbi:MAG: AsnC family transcriptional regulator, partial [Candidatus Nitrosotenuis sp.]|nr:AsnC family transcriptional regulator [Candidatus Nitrosotenuis sp.]